MRAKFVRVVSPYHCGYNNTYGSVVHVLIFDLYELKQRMSVEKEKAAKLREKIENELREMRIHANTCTSFDCQRVRSRWYFELAEYVLQSLNVMYNKITFVCEDIPTEIELLPEADPVQILLET